MVLKLVRKRSRNTKERCIKRNCRVDPEINRTDIGGTVENVSKKLSIIGVL